MTLMATACIGDFLVTLISRRSTNKHDEIPVTYTLTLTDIITDTSYSLSFNDENEALIAFATWIMIDEPSSIMEVMKDKLREELPKWAVP